MDELTQERVARNQSAFRDANQRIVSAAGEIGVDTQKVPFICECSDPGCTEVLVIALADYEAVRRHPRRFLHSAAHDARHDTVVAVHPNHVVVEKTGRAGEVAEDLAPR